MPEQTEKKYKPVIAKGELIKKVKATKFWLLVREADKNPTATFDVLEYLYGPEQTEKLVNEYAEMEDLTNFLVEAVSLAK